MTDAQLLSLLVAPIAALAIGFGTLWYARRAR